MKSYKEEITRQLEIRRETIAASLAFAKSKIRCFAQDEQYQNRYATEFQNQINFCTLELNKIESCISWINALP